MMLGKPISCVPCAIFLIKIFKNKKYIGIYSYAGKDYENSCPAIVDVDTFKRVQIRSEKLKKAPASGKAKIEYLLSGKVFCGMCGSNMIGESGNGRSGKTYYYYSCLERKKRNNCTKKNEKKDFIEWYVTEQTVEYVLTPERMEYIADKMMKVYKDEFSSNNIKSLERRLADIEGEISNAVDSSLEAPKKSP